MEYLEFKLTVNQSAYFNVQQSKGSSLMGQRKGFSDLDVEKLNRMYDCGYVGGAAPVPGAGTGAPVAAPGSNPIVDSFLSGLISGLGLGDGHDEKATAASS